MNGNEYDKRLSSTAVLLHMLAIVLNLTSYSTEMGQPLPFLTCVILMNAAISLWITTLQHENKLSEYCRLDYVSKNYDRLIEDYKSITRKTFNEMINTHFDDNDNEIFKNKWFQQYVDLKLKYDELEDECARLRKEVKR